MNSMNQEQKRQEQTLALAAILQAAALTDKLANNGYIEQRHTARSIQLDVSESTNRFRCFWSHQPP